VLHEIGNITKLVVELPDSSKTQMLLEDDSATAEGDRPNILVHYRELEQELRKERLLCIATCLGKDRCKNRISSFHNRSALEWVLAAKVKFAYANPSKAELKELARLLLCRYHQVQASYIVETWVRELSTFISLSRSSAFNSVGEGPSPMTVNGVGTK
jgi:hypothetical protein